MADFQADIEAQTIFKYKGVFVWFDQCVSTRYPRIFKKAEYFLLPFPTIYHVESAFSVVNDLLTKKRNRLDVTKRGDLRLRLSQIQPDVKSLAAAHQAQRSH